MAQPTFLFDYDGTLVDSLAAFERAMATAMADLGLPPLAGREDFLHLFDDNMGIGLAARGVGRTQMQEMFAGIRPLLLAEQDRTPFFGGVPELLRELSRHARVAVVTSNVGDVVRPKLAEAGLLEFVADIVGSDIEPSKVRKIQSFRARVPEGTPVYYVGDTLGDMIEGRAAGAVTVAVSWGWHSPERMGAANPDLVARAPGDILALVASRATASA